MNITTQLIIEATNILFSGVSISMSLFHDLLLENVLC